MCVCVVFVCVCVWVDISLCVHVCVCDACVYVCVVDTTSCAPSKPYLQRAFDVDMFIIPPYHSTHRRFSSKKLFCITLITYQPCVWFWGSMALAPTARSLRGNGVDQPTLDRYGPWSKPHNAAKLCLEE